MIQIKHGEYTIRYSENEDMWNCYDLSLEAPTLSKLKAKINKHDADLRRVENVPVLLLAPWGGKAESGWQVTLIDDDGKSVWVSKAIGSKRDGKARQKVALNTVMLDTPENRRYVEEYQRLVQEESEIAARRRALVEQMPRPKAEDFAALKKGKGA